MVLNNTLYSQITHYFVDQARYYVFTWIRKTTTFITMDVVTEHFGLYFIQCQIGQFLTKCTGRLTRKL